MENALNLPFFDWITDLQTLSNAEFERWRTNADVLEKDGHGDKVLRFADGTFFKLFRRKSLFSKTLLFPPAKRFADNAEALRKLGIACPDIIAVYRLINPPRNAVHYHPLQGTTLRDLLNRDVSLGQIELFAKLATFITELHDKGVYFRSLHLGNIVQTPTGQLGLIDISDLRCLGKPLPNSMRKRNYQHLLRYEQDWALVSPIVRSQFKP